jgi:hypothetical protein
MMENNCVGHSGRSLSKPKTHLLATQTSAWDKLVEKVPLYVMNE